MNNNPGSKALRPAGDYKKGVPCSHIGCLRHITHPCENCGRIAGEYPLGGIEDVFVFGKHNTETVRQVIEIDAQYILWLQGEKIVLFERYVINIAADIAMKQHSDWLKDNYDDRSIEF